MIEQLCKKDNFWRIVAFRICKDKFKADDIVQEMYLKLYDCQKQINDFYVIITMKNIFLQEIKKEKLFVDIDNYNFGTGEKFEIDDVESDVLNGLRWYEKELIEMSYDKSLREIQRELKINYQFVNRILKKTKTKLCQKRKKYNLKELETQ